MKVQAEGITKRYGRVVALRDTSFDVADGEIHALCGHNGAGKSTLMKILAGVVRLDEGELRINGQTVSFNGPLDAQRVGISLVDQELSLVPQLSVEENILLGEAHPGLLSRSRRQRPRIRALLERVGLDGVAPTTPVGSLAIGQRQLVEIARALGRGAGMVILDEPTATLSDAEIEPVFAAIREIAAHGSSVIFVSHRLGEVLSLCNRVTIFRDGERIATRSTQDLDRPALIEMMVGASAKHSESHPRSPEGSDLVASIEIRDLTVPRRLTEFSLDVHGGQIVGLAGQVGAGSSEVLKALAGLEPEASGSLTINSKRVGLGSPLRSRRAGIDFLPSDRKSEGLFLTHSVSHNLVATRLGALTRMGIVRVGRMAGIALHLAEVASIDAGRLRTSAGELSGGNQQKVLLGRCLERDGSRLLLLDEPTRGVDVGGRAELHSLIRRAADAGNAVLFASTELDEILSLADVVVTMFAGRIVSVRRRADATSTLVLADMTHRQTPIAVGAA